MAPPDADTDGAAPAESRRRGRGSPLLKVLDVNAQDRGRAAEQQASLLREMAEIVESSRRHAGAVSPVFAPANSEQLEATLSLHEPLALVSERHHRLVDGAHVWVGVKEGALVVLDDGEHDLFTRLERGEPPAALRDALAAERGISEEAAWQEVARVIARVAQSGLLRAIQGYTDRAKIPSPSRFARFHLTKACQLECAHCYADSSPHVDRSGELSTERWRQLILDFADAGGEQVLFTGGEALLHPGCLELMRVSRERGMRVTLFTNGLLVPRHADEIGRHAHVVQVSLDGPDAETNNAVRGPNTFQHILKAIDLLVKQGTPTRIGMTVVPSMWAAWREQFRQITDRYAGYSHVEFRLNYGVMEYGRGTQLDTSDGGNLEDAQRFMNRVNNRDGAKITRVKTGCGYGEQLVVGPDGTVYPCHLLDGRVCHIDDHPFPGVIALLRGLIRQTDVDHVEGCSTCEIRYLCGGSCRVLASRQTGSRLITDCTPEKKALKYQNLARTYAGQSKQ